MDVHAPSGRDGHISFEAEVRNVSAGGLGLEVPHPWGLLLRVGDRIVVHCVVEEDEVHCAGAIAWNRATFCGVRLEG